MKIIEMAAIFQKARWRIPPFFICLVTDSEVKTCPQNLVMIGQIIKKWQQFLEIQVGGSHHHNVLLTL